MTMRVIFACADDAAARNVPTAMAVSFLDCRIMMESPCKECGWKTVTQANVGCAPGELAGEGSLAPCRERSQDALGLTLGRSQQVAKLALHLARKRSRRASLAP